jgi:hypothetical protein
MDLPRAELRTHGLVAVAAAIAQRRERIGTWLRPRAAPLAITALATLCMLAGLDLIAHDFRKLREVRRPEPRIYLMSVSAVEAPRPAATTIIPVELTPSPFAAAAPGFPILTCDLERGVCTPVSGAPDGDTVGP